MEGGKAIDKEAKRNGLVHENSLQGRNLGVDREGRLELSDIEVGDDANAGAQRESGIALEEGYQQDLGNPVPEVLVDVEQTASLRVHKVAENLFSDEDLGLLLDLGM